MSKNDKPVVKVQLTQREEDWLTEKNKAKIQKKRNKDNQPKSEKTGAFEIMGKFLSKTAKIVEEDGEFCVRSPNNPTWCGGCYKTRPEAEARLKQVERFKKQK